MHAYIYIYIYREREIHTYIHTYVHTSIHPSIHTYIHTYIHICICNRATSRARLCGAPNGDRLPKGGGLEYKMTTRAHLCDARGDVCSRGLWQGGRIRSMSIARVGKVRISESTPSPPTKSFPTKSPRVKLSGRLPIQLYGHENSHPLELRVCLSQAL